VVRRRVARDQLTRIADAPARAPGMCLTVVTTSKMTAMAKTTEKAAKTKRGTIPCAAFEQRSAQLSPAIWFHAVPCEVWTVQDVLAPFVNLDDGGSHPSNNSNKQS
jgi:hypothetical protein